MRLIGRSLDTTTTKQSIKCHLQFPGCKQADRKLNFACEQKLLLQAPLIIIGQIVGLKIRRCHATGQSKNSNKNHFVAISTLK
jgi:hypothetical protein